MWNLLKRLWQALLGFFVAGVMAILPLVITVGIVVWVANFIEGVIGPRTPLGSRLRSLGLMFGPDTVVAYVVNWVLVLAFIFLLGVLVSLGAKQLLRRGLDAVLRRVPVVGGVYQTAEQLVDLFKKKDPSELRGMSVVFCFFSRESSSGLLALMPSPLRFRIDGQDYHAVIVPTAPVPFGGALLFVPVEFVKPAGMSVDGLMSIYVSMGVTAPQFLQSAAAPAQAAAAPPQA